ncbi:substrate-binding domain-containing protein [Streptomyces sp. XM4193]|uniref:GntR family transcriptional regulator n=1 Tax=Streptomyces sp. XM4193 TaxID=2929782 RepID=UPI001FF7EF74|nr:substrate-binding domain-containing protein [Streptomyces sp. XM4193]MCK1798084.1 substrate-binding domain-containing protein [Streptomyces sp. XM4193]
MKSLEGEDSFLKGPKYRQIAERLRRDISAGAWAPGEQLPVERELADSLSVSVNTLRRAMSRLVEEGVVQRRQGAGTFVCPDDEPAAAQTQSASAERRLIGVLVPSTTYYYPRVVDGIQRVLREARASVLLASSKYDLAIEDSELRAMCETGVHGLLLVPNLHLMEDPQGYVDRLRGLPVPYVLAERRPTDPVPDDPTTYVKTDHGGGVYRAIQHLRTLGHRRIGLMGRLHTGTSDMVAEGFTDAVRLLDVEPPAGSVLRRHEWTPAETAEYVRHCAGEGVTAVFCHGDRDAAALVVHARQNGLAVPEDLAVVAYDDEVAEVGDVPLTAVSPPKEEVGSLAARLLLDRLEQGATAPTHRVQLQPRLVIRASCGAERSAPANRPVVPA